MTTEMIHGAAGEAEVRNERAQRAVRAFRSMLPGLNGYVRAVTRNKSISIEVSTGAPRTDGRKIYYRPPIALGDLTPHQRGVCDSRDPDTLLQNCKACAIREEILISIYHEIAHIAFGTFEKPTEATIAEAMDRAIEEAPGRYADLIRKRWASIPDSKKGDHLNLSSLINPFLPMLVNVIEDARVDDGMFKARRGTKVMYDAYINSVFHGGVESDDGEFVTWDSRPLNSQIIIGVFVLACEYDYKGWLAPEIEEALEDDVLQELATRVRTLRSAAGSYDLAFLILARLRELGFCQTENDQDEEKDEDIEQDEVPDDDNSETSGAESDQQDGDGGPGGSDVVGDSEPDSDRHPEPESTSGGSSGDSASQSGSDDGASDSVGDESSSGEAGKGSDRGKIQPPDSQRADSNTDGSGPTSERGEGADGRGDGDLGSGDDGGPETDDDLRGADDSRRPEGGDRLGDAGEDGPGEERANEAREGRPLGTPEEAGEDIAIFSGHRLESEEPSEDAEEIRAIEVTIIQGAHFESPSSKIIGVREHKFGSPLMENGQDVSDAWRDQFGYGRYYDRPLEPEESIMGPALLEMRRTFSDNQRANFQRNLKSGRVNGRVLGKRAPVSDPRLFQKKRLPGKKSYAVVIGIDISGSTRGMNLVLAKQAAYAQAELCHRMGIAFAIYGHTANLAALEGHRGVALDMYEIKSFDQPWSDRQKEAFREINADAGNIDGHTIEYYRKLIERQPATDKIIMYYTDGQMPAENYAEELEILQREIAYCKRNSIVLMGVGIRTDSPTRHGLDTVQVDTETDVPKVVRHLQGGLLHNR